MIVENVAYQLSWWSSQDSLISHLYHLEQIIDFVNNLFETWICNLETLVASIERGSSKKRISEENQED